MEFSILTVSVGVLKIFCLLGVLKLFCLLALNAEIETVFFQDMFCLSTSNTEKRCMGPQYLLSTEYSIVKGKYCMFVYNLEICRLNDKYMLL